MNKLKVLVHTCYLGATGYNYHARGFCRELSKHVDLKVNNFTVDDDEIRYDELDNRLVFSGHWPKDYAPDIEIALEQPCHTIFPSLINQNLRPTSFKIAYTVWESTKLEQGFIDILKRYDQVWVVSKWHKKLLIEQGISEPDIFVVPEGYNDDILDKSLRREVYDTERFSMLFTGRWDYRKCVPDILQAFMDEFCNDEPIDFILQADNPFARDGMNTTEERLVHYFGDKVDPRIKVLHFCDRKTYLDRMSSANVLVTCARAEGWNIPLMEAIVMGVPVIYCYYGGQREFTDLLTPGTNSVPINGKSPASSGVKFGGPDISGEYAVPDFSALREAMRAVYAKYDYYKATALKDAKKIKKEFTWDRAAEKALNAFAYIHKSRDIITDKGRPIFSIDLKAIHPELSIGTWNLSNKLFLHGDERAMKAMKEPYVAMILPGEPITSFEGKPFVINPAYQLPEHRNVFEITYLDGPRVEIKGNTPTKYHVLFHDADTGKCIYRDVIENNCWAKASPKYYVHWRILIVEYHTEVVLYDETLYLKGKVVKIEFDSKSLGDTIAWVPYASEFQKKHECEVVVSCFNASLFAGQYPNITFAEPQNAVVPELFAQYKLGVFYRKEGDVAKYHPRDFRNMPLQQIASDILGLEFEQIRPAVKTLGLTIKKNVTIAIHSTAQMKYWNNPTGWQDVVNFLVEHGYEVINLSKEESGYMGNQNPANCTNKTGDFTLQDRMMDIEESELFIGISSGLSWLAWALNVPVILISGFTAAHTEFTGPDVSRIINREVCNSCWNNFYFDRGNWNSCPIHAGSERQFECSKQISSATVIQEIEKMLPLLHQEDKSAL
jgi:autotransporter strand-loop-strand O-heptosyltransferase